MALQKRMDLPNGTNGNYWRIVGLQVDRMTNTAHYIIALFKDQAHGQAMSPNLGVAKKFSFAVTNNQTVGNLMQFGYASIKARAASMVHPIGKPNDPLVVCDPDLAGATDV